MKFVIQRVNSAKVEIIDNGSSRVPGEIRKGFLVLIGVSQEDDETVADKLIHKLVNLRIFEDDNGKTNLNIDAVNGEMLLVSQFTLYADCKHGNRPSFTDAGSPDRAEELYEYIVSQCRDKLGNNRIATGEFGADMQVNLVNDGPFTIILDSEKL